MASKAQLALKKITQRLQNVLGSATKNEELMSVAKFTIDLIVKRTRLGYGVDQNFGTKRKLKPLSEKYKDYRRGFPSLSPTTTPGRSNLSLTGQMLDSMKVMRISNGRATIGPSGTRKGSFLSNLQVAEFQEGQGRTFNRISALEFQQVLRFYRKRFGDLLKKRDLIR